jgi:radical SAM protein with 4Fe4S-binding SPASM domain
MNNQLSHFVYKTKRSAEESDYILFHSITKKELPVDSDENELKSHFFLKGQEREAIRERLFNVEPKYLHFTILNTWECNLRCSHCCVLHLLQKKDTHKIDKSKIRPFLEQYFDKFKNTPTLSVYFLGGESLIYPEEVLSFIDIFKEFTESRGLRLDIGTTTNLAFQLTPEHIRVFEALNTIGISLDGFKEYHNKQRKSLIKEEDPFDITVGNIKKLVKLGFRDKLFVQAALKKEVYSEEYAVDFTKFLLRLGVKLERTKVGSVYPTEKTKTLDPLWGHYKTHNILLKDRPCCKYELMQNIQLNPDNILYDNYYTQVESVLGKLDDHIDDIFNKNIDLIMKTVPALNDENCLNCPALGYCWGGCVNSFSTVKYKPSELCSKEYIVPLVKQLADDGNLINYRTTLYGKNKDNGKRYNLL